MRRPAACYGHSVDSWCIGHALICTAQLLVKMLSGFSKQFATAKPEC